MDPLSQGVAGALLAHAVVGKRLPRAAALIGLGAGMAPDLDVLINIAGDPTAGWYWHRGPTHSLLAIPIGGLLCALPFLLWPKLREQWKAVLIAATLGVASHGPLDTLTSYGTLLFWPFSDYRATLDWMPIIDPVFTLTLALLVLLAVYFKRRSFTFAAIGLGLTYVGFGAFQHHRAIDATRQVAEIRGHEPGRLRVMPAPASLLLWRGIYEHEGELHAVGVRTPYTGAVVVKPGDSRPLSDGAAFATDPAAMRHFRRFNWFADGRAHPVDENPAIVGDGRYSGDPAGFAPLWGIRQTPDGVIRYDPPRMVDAQALLDAMFGRDPSYRPMNETDADSRPG
jgi:inner membrane protein